jgi:addiction module RelB/DinJ family antitoxin
MQTSSILIKIDPELKAKAQKNAKKMGLSLSMVINHYLKDFITSKSLTFDYEDEEPSQFLIDSIKKSEDDIKAGRVISFDNPQEALDYVDSLIKHDRSKKQTKGYPVESV